mmetsp:Transcript_86083/g.248554  ORF Transcript_86083/g.248554 Transcript_86083/m.248554 type:complete len:565 (+) Transcript_86083:54-1748(+)
MRMAAKMRLAVVGLVVSQCACVRQVARPVIHLKPEPVGFDRVAERERCSKISQCYCIRGTHCGWCESANRSMLGTKAGPTESETCALWFGAAQECPTLYCRGTDHEERMWWVHCAWFPMVCLFGWIITYVWRAIIRARYQPSRDELAVLNSVNFSTGAAAFRTDASSKGPEWAEAQATDFFGTKRTFESFRKGMGCPPDERLPTKVSRPYELNLSDLSCKPGQNYEKSRVGPHRLSVTVQVALQWRTALGSSVTKAMFLMFVASWFIMFWRCAARYLDLASYQWLAMATQEVGAVAIPLQTAVGMLLSFYALNRIAWYWSVLMEGHILQGRAHDLGMIGGALKNDTDEDWHARYMLYRHAMLTLFFTYQPFTPRLRFLGFGPLLKCGLLESDEAEILKRAHRSPGTVTESWLSSWIEANLQDESRQQAFQSLRELRASISVVQALVDQRAPVSFESLLYIVVYALVAILPISPSNVDYSNREAVMEGIHVATVFGVGILGGFYLALIHMLRHLQAPFDHIGAPHDALNPIALMNNTERKLRDYLTLPVVNSRASSNGKQQQQQQ